MKQLYYDMYSAQVNYGVKKHPQADMRDLGFKLINSVAQSVADAWWFTVEDFDFELPGYLKPMEYNLNYWMNHCYQTCEYFQHPQDTLEDKKKYCCYGGSICKKDKERQYNDCNG